MPVLPAKAISSSATAMPPSLMSWPALMSRRRSSAWVALNAAAKVLASTSGESSPIWIQSQTRASASEPMAMHDTVCSSPALCNPQG